MLNGILRVVACAAALALAEPVQAHDLWIEPATFTTGPGKVLALRLRVGQDLVGDPVARDEAAIDEFVLVDRKTRRMIPGRDGSDPAGIIRIDSPGLLVVGYRSHPSAVVLPAAKFNDYLREEGLEAVAAERTKRNQSNADARELFSRAAKSLVLSEAAAAGEGDRPLGLRLELVAEVNPYRTRKSDDLPVRLLFESRGLTGALVVAVNKLDPSAKLTARTDSNGRVRFKLPRGGMWMVKAVHMVPAPAASGADWESIWASLTFELSPEGSASK
jgi:uncharacterized GH25 family protein